MTRQDIMKTAHSQGAKAGVADEIADIAWVFNAVNTGRQAK